MLCKYVVSSPILFVLLDKLHHLQLLEDVAVDRGKGQHIPPRSCSATFPTCEETILTRQQLIRGEARQGCKLTFSPTGSRLSILLAQQLSHQPKYLLKYLHRIKFSWRFLYYLHMVVNTVYTKHTACTCVNYIVRMREDQTPPPCIA